MVAKKTITLVGCLVLAASACWAQPAAGPVRLSWSIAIHGGAGTPPSELSPADREAYQAALARILKQGQTLLASGKSSLDVVEQVVTSLEDDPLFNAGKGAVMNEQGHHELDAAIMDGSTLNCGAVAAVTIVRNPIQLARLVMEKTPHVLLMGQGAEEFARQMKVTLVPNSYFWTERAQKGWDAARKDHGTTGCVALDQHGNLAAATSTGGLTFKKWGRIGDSPIIGAGTYADNRYCAVSCTGIGEEFIRHSVAYDISARLHYLNQTVDQAVHSVMTEVLKPNSGGVIAVDRFGHSTVQANSGGMYWGQADVTGTFKVGLKAP